MRQRNLYRLTTRTAEETTSQRYFSYDSAVTAAVLKIAENGEENAVTLRFKKDYVSFETDTVDLEITPCGKRPKTVKPDKWFATNSCPHLSAIQFKADHKVPPRALLFAVDNAIYVYDIDEALHHLQGRNKGREDFEKTDTTQRLTLCLPPLVHGHKGGLPVWYLVRGVPRRKVVVSQASVPHPKAATAARWVYLYSRVAF